MKKYLTAAVASLTAIGLFGITAPATATTIVAPHPAGGALTDKVKVLLPRVSDGPVGITLPTAVDLSSWAVPVGDQGWIGSCVAWAINYSMMGWYSRYQHISSTGVLFAPMYVYSQIHVNNGEDGGGAYPEDAYAVANTQGVDTQSDYVPQGNFDFSNKPTDAQKTNAALNKSFEMISLYNTGGTPGPAADNVIKASIASFRPVALTIPVYSAFDALNSTSYSLNARQVIPSSFRGLHEVFALGYDATGVTIENSWGTGWGKKGFAHLDWNFIEQYSYEASTMAGLQSAPIPPVPVPQVPSAPKSLVVSSNNTVTATISWKPPTNGGPITGYRVSRSGVDTHGVSTWSQIIPVTYKSQTFTLLKPGTKYTLSVSAINPYGTGSAASTTTTTKYLPLSAPQRFSLSASHATRSVTIHWLPPANNGGYAVTKYRVSRNGTDIHGKTWSATISVSARSQKFTSLKWGYTYTFTVQAITEKATSPTASGHARL